MYGSFCLSLGLPHLILPFPHALTPKSPLNTTSYGDIKPGTVAETMMSLVIMLCGAVVYSGLTATIASLAANMDVTADRFANKLDDMRRFLQDNKLPNEVQDTTRAYYLDLWLQVKGVESEQTLQSMPFTMRRTVTRYVLGTVLKHHFLFDKLPKSFVKRVTCAMVHCTLPQGHVLMREGEVVRKLFVLISGELQYFHVSASRVPVMLLLAK